MCQPGNLIKRERSVFFGGVVSALKMPFSAGVVCWIVSLGALLISEYMCINDSGVD